MRLSAIPKRSRHTLNRPRPPAPLEANGGPLSERIRAGMGTTCVALSLCDGRAFAACVGDSRLYLVRHGVIYRMTEDHSFVAAMVRAGLLTREEARNHEDRNVIPRAPGTRETVKVGAGARLLLSADGRRHSRRWVLRSRFGCRPRCCVRSKKPRDRFQTTQELDEELERRVPAVRKTVTAAPSARTTRLATAARPPRDGPKSGS